MRDPQKATPGGSGQAVATNERSDAHIVPKPEPARAILLEPADDEALHHWVARAAALAATAPRVSRGKPQQCKCDLCGRAGRWRHRVTLAHLVRVPPLEIETVSILGANACCRCAGRVRAGDAALIESLKASRRQGVRDRVLREVLESFPCQGEA